MCLPKFTNKRIGEKNPSNDRTIGNIQFTRSSHLTYEKPGQRVLNESFQTGINACHMTPFIMKFGKSR